MHCFSYSFVFVLSVPILVEQSKRFLFSIHDFEDVLKKCYFTIITTILIVAVFTEDSVVLKSSLAKEIRKVQTTLIIDNSCFFSFLFLKNLFLVLSRDYCFISLKPSFFFLSFVFIDFNAACVIFCFPPPFLFYKRNQWLFLAIPFENDNESGKRNMVEANQNSSGSLWTEEKPLENVF